MPHNMYIIIIIIYYILAATAENIGLNTSEIALNKETICRMRRTHRKNIA